MDRPHARRGRLATVLFRTAGLGLTAAGLIGLSLHSAAIEEIGIDIGETQGAGWNARDVSVSAVLAPEGVSTARISIAYMKLSNELGALERVTVVCDKPTVTPPQFRCRDARVGGILGKLGRQNFRADLSYHSGNGSLAFALKGLKIAAGTVKLEGTWQDAGWRATLESGSLNLKDLTALIKPWFALPAGFGVEGHASAHIVAAGKKSLESAQVRLKAETLTVNNAEGTVATDRLGFALDARIEPAGADWKIDGRIQAGSGQAYVDPIFVDLANNALDVTLQGRWLGATAALQIDKLDFDQKGIARGSAAGRIALGEKVSIGTLDVALASLEFPGAYATLMQPWLLDTEFKEFETSGRISGTVSIEDTAPAALDLQLDNLTAQDKTGKLGIRGLQGRVLWLGSARRAHKNVTDTEPFSYLAWKGANAYGLTGGTARIEFAASGADFRILKPTVLPILDGGLAIETLSIRDFGAEDLSLRFNAVLQPISMALLSKAFGWPEFGGTIEGRIPQVSYDNKVLSVGGDLEAQAFDGRVVVNGLKLRNPLSNYPRLNANITLRNLDLEALTGTFSFGTITGRLHGDIHDLELFRWAPVRMDMRLYTPPGDKSKHLISQRAVNNLSNIGGGGGGVAAALQGGFLRFFENFRYQHLGLSCRLQNDVCRMEGVAPAAGNSYYIVKGSGIPRIDIIGNARQVDWPRLVSQLQAIRESGGPVVE